MMIPSLVIMLREALAGLVSSQQTPQTSIFKIQPPAMPCFLFGPSVCTRRAHLMLVHDAPSPSSRGVPGRAHTNARAGLAEWAHAPSAASLGGSADG